MEKFGIFELLDTLSALTQPKSEEQVPPQRASVRDEAFAPPPSPTENDIPRLPPNETGKEDAFARLIANQEAISKRIDKQKE